MKIPSKIIKVIRYVLASALCLGIIFVLGFVDHRQQKIICKQIIIHIDESVDHDFINENTILELINSKEKIVGKPIGSINTALLEKIILSNPYVASVQVYSTIAGDLHADVNQRDPIVRIVNMHDEQYYIDKSGIFMPVSSEYTPPVIVANGYIFDPYSEIKVQEPIKSLNDSLDTVNVAATMLGQVYSLSNFITANSFWSANLEQIYVNQDQELELIPRVGNQRIILGDTTDMSDKFKRLMIFYKEGLSKTGWNNYNIINLKYRNQVVCSKTNL
jgi:cell division protein FtsQ